jgi:hypothetical protein
MASPPPTSRTAQVLCAAVRTCFVIVLTSDQRSLPHESTSEGMAGSSAAISMAVLGPAGTAAVCVVALVVEEADNAGQAPVDEDSEDAPPDLDDEPHPAGKINATSSPEPTARNLLLGDAARSLTITPPLGVYENRRAIP